MVIWVVGLGLAMFLVVVVRGAPYVPTHKKQLTKAFTELVELSADDTVVDLGAGDGVVLQAASEQGASAIGYELNPLLVYFMKLRFRRHSNISVQLRDYLTLTKLPENVTVVYAFASSRDIKKIDKKMMQWSKHQPLMLISYGFTIKHKQPDKSLEAFSLYRYS